MNTKEQLLKMQKDYELTLDEYIKKSEQNKQDLLTILDRKAEKIAEEQQNKKFKSLSHLSPKEKQLEIGLARDAIIDIINSRVLKLL